MKLLYGILAFAGAMLIMTRLMRPVAECDGEMLGAEAWVNHPVGGPMESISGEAS